MRYGGVLRISATGGTPLASFISGLWRMRDLPFPWIILERMPDGPGGREGFARNVAVARVNGEVATAKSN